MANTRFQYVRDFEQEDACLRNTFMVVRLDGRGFSKFCKLHDFSKPNDKNALDLLNRCAMECVKEFPDIFLAFGQSDEYSFVFKRSTKTFKRRKSKIISCLTSLFSSSYVFYWKEFMGNTELATIPQFDARIVLYPTLENLKDYFSWRQADCHINNLYNTCFWNLVLHGGRSEAQAEAELAGTFSKDKNELLYSKFSINYNNEPAMFRKGNVLLSYRVPGLHDDGTKVIRTDQVVSGQQDDAKDTSKAIKPKRDLRVVHIDIIKQPFWDMIATYCD